MHHFCHEKVVSRTQSNWEVLTNFHVYFLSVFCMSPLSYSLMDALHSIDDRCLFRLYVYIRRYIHSGDQYYITCSMRWRQACFQTSFAKIIFSFIAQLMHFNRNVFHWMPKQILFLHVENYRVGTLSTPHWQSCVLWSLMLILELEHHKGRGCPLPKSAFALLLFLLVLWKVP